MNPPKHSKNMIWIIILAVVLIGAGAYFYFQGSATPSASGLLQSPDSPDVSAQILSFLAQIQSIHIDANLFKDPAYQTLRDYSVAIPIQNVGRVNPFAPIPGVVNHTVTPAGH